MEAGLIEYVFRVNTSGWGGLKKSALNVEKSGLNTDINKSVDNAIFFSYYA